MSSLHCTDTAGPSIFIESASSRPDSVAASAFSIFLLRQDGLPATEGGLNEADHVLWMCRGTLSFHIVRHRIDAYEHIKYHAASSRTYFGQGRFSAVQVPRRFTCSFRRPRLARGKVHTVVICGPSHVHQFPWGFVQCTMAHLSTEYGDDRSKLKEICVIDDVILTIEQRLFRRK